MSQWPGRLVLLGHPLGHSLSPVFQNAALRAAGIPLVYETLDTPRSALSGAVEQLRRVGAAGNVTIPYKETMVRSCDRVTDTSRAIGAINTFWTAVDGALVGDNTDAGGFEIAVQSLLGGAPGAQTVALLGAGGAAGAILHAMKGWSGSGIRVYSRTRERAEALVARIGAEASVVESPEAAARGATLLVNATPVGMNTRETPISAASLDEGCAVLDIVVQRGGTELVRRARARGLRASDGLTMLVEQGALAFERWFSVAPDRAVMWAALQDYR